MAPQTGSRSEEKGPGSGGRVQTQGRAQTRLHGTTTSPGKVNELIFPPARVCTQSMPEDHPSAAMGTNRNTFTVRKNGGHTTGHTPTATNDSLTFPEVNLPDRMLRKPLACDYKAYYSFVNPALVPSLTDFQMQAKGNMHAGDHSIISGMRISPLVITVVHWSCERSTYK